jgi:hypothetical protein
VNKNDDIEEMLEQPIGQKAAKKVALVAEGKPKRSKDANCLTNLCIVILFFRLLLI